MIHMYTNTSDTIWSGKNLCVAHIFKNFSNASRVVQFLTVSEKYKEY